MESSSSCVGFCTILAFNMGLNYSLIHVFYQLPTLLLCQYQYLHQPLNALVSIY